MLVTKNRSTSLAALVFSYGFVAACASAQLITLNSQDQGWYDSEGFHDSDNTNYVIGTIPGVGTRRDFFAFNSTGLAGATVTGATLRLFNPTGGYASPTSSETVGIYAFEGNLSELLGGTGGTPAYEDLGSGTLFGTKVVIPPTDNQFIEFGLNDAFLSYINGVHGEFAIGGAIFTLSGDPDAAEHIFAFSNGADAMQQLILTVGDSAVVPEPSTYSLFGAGLLGLLAAFRRSLRARATTHAA